LYSPTVLLSPCGSWRIVNQEDAANAKGVRGVNSVLEQEKEVNENVYFLDVSRRLIMLHFDGTRASPMDGAIGLWFRYGDCESERWPEGFLLSR